MSVVVFVVVFVVVAFLSGTYSEGHPLCAPTPVHVQVQGHCIGCKVFTNISQSVYIRSASAKTDPHCPTECHNIISAFRYRFDRSRVEQRVNQLGYYRQIIYVSFFFLQRGVGLFRQPWTARVVQ